MPRTKTKTTDSARNNGAPTQPTAPDVRMIPLALVDASPYNPREPDDAELGDLAASLQSVGLQQPVVVRPLGERFQLVAGHRRAAAARSLGWESIAASVSTLDDESAATRTLEENIKRRDLGGLEKARFLQRYIEQFKVSQVEVGERFHMAQETVSNLLRLLDAPVPILKLVDEGKLTPAHVKALLSVKDEKRMVKLAEEAVEYNQSTRTVETNAKWANEAIISKAKEKASNDTVRNKTLPKLVKRLLEGLTGDGSKDKPFADPKHPGLPVLFGKVKIDYSEYTPQQPAFPKDKTYNPDSDKELQAALKQMGLSIGYGENALSRYEECATKAYTLTSELRRKLGVKGKAACPCGAGHVVVRGWPEARSYPYTADTKKPVETAIYCADPAAVTLALARRKIKAVESETERRAQEEIAFNGFLTDVVPSVGPEVAAFLWVTTGGDVADIGVAKGSPGVVWDALCKKQATKYNEQRYSDRPRLGEVLRLIAETPATAPPPEGATIGQAEPRYEDGDGEYDDDNGPDICENCNNELQGEAFACAKCDEEPESEFGSVKFCSEACQTEHMNDMHGHEEDEAQEKNAETEIMMSDPKELLQESEVQA